MGFIRLLMQEEHSEKDWGANIITKFNAFTEYYGRSDKLHFFAAYIDEKDIDLFIGNELRNMFNILYGHYRKGD